MSYVVGGVKFPSVPIMIGAGAAKTPARTKRWLSGHAVVSGSYTPQPQSGNAGDRLFHPETSEEFLAQGPGFNWLGMPNPGFQAAAKELRWLASEHPLIVSVAGFSIDDYLSGLDTFWPLTNVKAIELNFGCPNMLHGKILSFDAHTLNELFVGINAWRLTPIWVKFSPYSDPGQ